VSKKILKKIVVAMMMFSIVTFTPGVLSQAAVEYQSLESIVTPRTTVRVKQYTYVYYQLAQAQAGKPSGQINGSNVTANIISTSGGFVQVAIMGDPYWNGATMWIANSNLY